MQVCTQEMCLFLYSLSGIFRPLISLTDCWKYRHMTVSVETKDQGTDHQLAADIRETGDGGVDRCVCVIKVM